MLVSYCKQTIIKANAIQESKASGNHWTITIAVSSQL